MDTFGTIELRGSYWMIQCEPHVAAKLKRVFPRVPTRASDAIPISNTPENARDLEWFIQRYPMQVLQPDELKREANDHRQTEARLIDLMMRRAEVPKVPLAKPPRDYQEAAAYALEIKRGLLLADDVGVGKTVSGICAIVNPDNLPALIVVPAHLPRHWAEKLGEFAPHLRVHVIKHGKPYPLVKPKRGRQQDLLAAETIPDVIVCTYHKLRGWAETLAGTARLVIFEECQQLRNSGSLIYTACTHVARKARRVLGLSATPIYGYGQEFFWVVDAILPDALGSREEFLREWCMDSDRIKDADQFGSYLRREGIMLRRTRRDVGRELPPLQKIVHTIDCDVDVLDKLQGEAIALARIVLAHNQNYSGEKFQAAGEFDTLMRQATGISKAPYVADFVQLLLDSGESVVLFGWHRACYKIWLERLAQYNPVMYTGTESATQKAAAEEAFKCGESKLLIMSLRSGAGVDGLQHRSSICVFGELDWAPGVHEQCMGRLDRDGQASPVMAYFLVSEHGADPTIAGVLGVKREQIEAVRNPDGELIQRIETGEHHIKRLAREFLQRRGEAVPDESTVATLPRKSEAEPA